jgi:hypothetical protein
MDLPAPDSPTMPSVVRGGMLKLTSCSTRIGPNGDLK